MVYCKALSWILLQNCLLEYTDAPYVHKNSQLWVQKVTRRDVSLLPDKKLLLGNTSPLFAEGFSSPWYRLVSVPIWGFSSSLGPTAPVLWMLLKTPQQYRSSDFWQSNDKGLGLEARIALDWAPCVMGSWGEENKLEQGAVDNSRRVKLVFPTDAWNRERKGRATGAGELLRAAHT